MKKYLKALGVLYSYILHYKWYYWGLVLIVFLSGSLNIVQIKATESLVNMTLAGHIVWPIIIFFVGIIVLNVLFTFINGRLSTLLSVNVNRKIKEHISHIIINADYQQLSNERMGDILNTVNNDVNVITGFISGNMCSILSQVMMAIIAIVYLITVNPLLCLITFIYTPLGMFFTFKINNKIGKIHADNVEIKADSLSIFEQFLSNIPIVKSFMMEKKALLNIQRTQQQLLKSNMKLAKFNSLLQVACGAINSFPRVLYLGFGALLVFNGEITLGLFVAMYDFLGYVIGPSTYLPFMIQKLNRCIASLNRVERLNELSLNSKKQIEEISGQPSVEAKNISFSYDGSKKILDNLSFTFKGNGLYIIKGDSGAGKTTLMDIIAGLYKPDSGKMLICNKDPALNDIGGLVSVIPQDVYIFRGSLAENIHFAKPDMPIEELVKIASSYPFLSFVEDLPEGFDTVVGDGNRAISGGQRQRIAFAQLLLKNSPIWIMDEPIAAIDDETRKLLISLIHSCAQDHLIIFCAHSNIDEKMASQIVCLGEKQNEYH